VKIVVYLSPIHMPPPARLYSRLCLDFDMAYNLYGA